jgi:hypothetical protein
MRELRAPQWGAALRHGAGNLAAKRADLFPEVFHKPDGQREVATHRGAQHLWRPRIGARAVEHYGGDAECGCATHDGADVTGILDAFQENMIALHRPGLRDFDLGDDALGRLGVCDCRKGFRRNQDRGCLVEEISYFRFFQRFFRCDDRQRFPTMLKRGG